MIFASKQNMTRLLLLFLAVGAVSCGQDSDNPKTASPASEAPVTETAPAAETPEPPFMQEGVLEFRTPESGKPLVRLEIEIAPNSDERAQGLMWRKKMAEKQAMLFVFDQMEPQSFWMHNTYLPLDMIFLNDRFEVVKILKNIPALNDAPRQSGVPAQYVVEVNAGIADRFGIREGSKAAWADWTTNKSFGGEISL